MDNPNDGIKPTENYDKEAWLKAKKDEQCHPRTHTYIEALNNVLWKGEIRVMIFCTQCGHTKYLGISSNTFHKQKKKDVAVS
jgi:hypothetical protein